MQVIYKDDKGYWGIGAFNTLTYYHKDYNQAWDQILNPNSPPRDYSRIIHLNDAKPKRTQFIECVGETLPIYFEYRGEIITKRKGDFLILKKDVLSGILPFKHPRIINRGYVKTLN